MEKELNNSLRSLIDGQARESFTLLKSIGEGAFSSVYLGHFLNDQSNLVAIKRIKKTQAFLGMNLGVECSLLRKLGRHENIIKYVGLYESPTCYYIVLEYMEGGELLDILLYNLENGEAYSEATVALILRQVCNAVAHCHKNQIIHRDLKPENVLVRRGTVFNEKIALNALKLCDFGLAIVQTLGVYLLWFHQHYEGSR
ncbi:calcium/calmodulin-dependent protein kinase type 1G-like [Zophobas morio]|uniref:calcium/calmodulin-dependent protein kinase type 1G-like n=1 Tax=Zophobas morio TaxID=2755281 RepID=UPI003082A1E0